MATPTTMFSGFAATDFDVFSVPGLELRMSALKEYLRPKLVELGDYMAPRLTQALGRTMFAHVAKHARRTVNPPRDSWVAFSEDARGYKQWPTFMVGLWETHLFAQFGVIYESPRKRAFALSLSHAWDEVRRAVPGDYAVYLDHTKPESCPLKGYSEAEYATALKKVAAKKNGDLLFGRELPRAEVLQMAPGEVLTWVGETCERLAPLYGRAFDDAVDG